MVTIRYFANLAQEVHIVDAAAFIFVKEADEAFELYCSQFCDSLSQHVQQGLRRDEANVSIVSLLHQLDDLILLVWVDLGVDCLVHTVTEVDSSESFTCKIPYQVADRDHVIIVFK